MGGGSMLATAWGPSGPAVAPKAHTPPWVSRQASPAESFGRSRSDRLKGGPRSRPPIRSRPFHQLTVWHSTSGIVYCLPSTLYPLLSTLYCLVLIGRKRYEHQEL